MASSEKEVLDALRAGWDEAEQLFSREGKPLQERIAVHGFLRVLGVEHAASDIIKRGPEPIDVWFQDARFQVTEIMHPPRPRDLEIRQRAVRARTARRLEDMMESGTITSDPMTPQGVLELVYERAAEKAAHYAGQCSGIDLLAYVNLRRRHLYPTGPFPEVPDLQALGWRSVSLVMERFAIVLSAGSTAPAFLRDPVGKGAEWQGLDSVFDW
jgi:putative endonuclease (uncharacterized protein DUF1780)